MDSGTESPKIVANHSSSSLPNSENFAGSDGLTGFLQNWLMDWLTLPAKEIESFEFVSGNLISACLSTSLFLLHSSSKLTFRKQLGTQVRWRMHMFSVFHVGHNHSSIIVLTTPFIFKDWQLISLEKCNWPEFRLAL